MRFLIIIAAIVALTLYILALADGPSLIEIIDNPKF